jgi:hypothetical protein
MESTNYESPGCEHSSHPKNRTCLLRPCAFSKNLPSRLLQRIVLRVQLIYYLNRYRNPQSALTVKVRLIRPAPKYNPTPSHLKPINLISSIQQTSSLRIRNFSIRRARHHPSASGVDLLTPIRSSGGNQSCLIGGAGFKLPHVSDGCAM